MSQKDHLSPENNGARLAGRKNCVTPAVDIFEQEGVLTLVADMPGVEGDQVKINIESGILSLEARGRDEPLGDELLFEFFSTAYFRQFRLLEQLDLDRTEARIENGVLTLKLPKAEAVLPRRIEVKTVH